MDELCVKCGKNPRYKKGERVFRLCASCAWENLQVLLYGDDEEIEQGTMKCSNCKGSGIVYDAEFDKWFNCSECNGTGRIK